jgi:hypothetical protein
VPLVAQQSADLLDEDVTQHGKKRHGYPLVGRKEGCGYDLQAGDGLERLTAVSQLLLHSEDLSHQGTGLLCVSPTA